MKKNPSPETARTDTTSYPRTSIRPVKPDYKPRTDAESNVSAIPTGAVGVGGWLLLLIIRLWIGSGIRVIGG